MTKETEQLNAEVATLRGRIVGVLTDDENVSAGAAILAAGQIAGSLIRDYVAETDHKVAYVDLIRAIWQQIEPINGQTHDDKCRRQLEIITLLTAGNSVDEQGKIAMALLHGVVATLPTVEKRKWTLSKMFAAIERGLKLD